MTDEERKRREEQANKLRSANGVSKTAESKPIESNSLNDRASAANRLRAANGAEQRDYGKDPSNTWADRYKAMIAEREAYQAGMASNSSTISSASAAEGYRQQRQAAAQDMTASEFNRRKAANGGVYESEGVKYTDYNDYVNDQTNPGYELLANRYEQSKSNTASAVGGIFKAAFGEGTVADAYAKAKASHENSKAIKQQMMDKEGLSFGKAKDKAEQEHEASKLKATQTKYDSMSDDDKKILDEIGAIEASTESAQFAKAFGQGGSIISPGDIEAQQISRRSDLIKQLEDKGYSGEDITALTRYRQSQNNAEMSQRRQEAIDEAYDEHPFLAQAGGSIASVATNVASPIGVAEYVKAKVTDTPVDVNSPYLIGSNVTDELREGVMDRHDWVVGKNENGEGGYDVFDMLYGTAMSSADSIVAGAIMPGIGLEASAGSGFLGRTAVKAANGVLGGGLIGAEAAVSTMKDLTERGASSSQALTGGLVAGAFEGLFESFSIGEFKALQESGKAGVKNILLDLAKSAGVNASEEGFTEIANIMYDTLANGDISQYQQAIDGYIEKGLSPTEARDQVIKDLTFQVIESAAGGALQGLFMGPFSVGLRQVENAKTGIAVRQKGNAQTLIDTAQEKFADNKKSQSLSMADKYSQRLAEGKRVSNRQLGSLQNTMIEEIYEESGKNAKKIQSVSKDTIAKEYAEIIGSEAASYDSLKKSESDTVDSLYNLITGKAKRSDIRAINDNENARSVYDKYASKMLKTDIVADQNARYVAGMSDKNYAIEGKTGGLTADRVRQYQKPTVNIGGKETTVQSLVAGKNGNLTATLEDGSTKTVALKDIADANVRALWTEATKNNPETAQAMVNGFTGGSVAEYTQAFYKASELAATGMDLSQLNSVADQFGLKKALSSEAIVMAHDAGIRSLANKGGFVNLSKSSQSKFVKNQLDSIQGIVDGVESIKNSVTVVAVDNLYDVQTDAITGETIIKSIAGKYSKDKSVIFISVNDAPQKVITRVLGHEMFHHLENLDEKNGTSYTKEIGDYVLNTLTDKKGKDWVNKVLEEEYSYYTAGNNADTRKLRESELIADSMFNVFSDQEAVDKFTVEHREAAQTFFEKLKSIIAEIKNHLKSLAAGKNFREIDAWLEIDKDNPGKLQKLSEMFFKALNDSTLNSGSNISDELRTDENAEMVEIADEMVDASAIAEDGKVIAVTSGDGSVIALSHKTYENGGRDALERTLRERGHTEEEITSAIEFMDNAMSFLNEVAKDNNYLADKFEADFYVDPVSGKAVLSSLVKNDEYTVNFDLSTICKKRVAYQNVINHLLETGKFDEVVYTDEAVAAINEILKNAGFETACVACFVESRRMFMQPWAEKFTSTWNSAVRSVNPNAKHIKDITESDIRKIEEAKKKFKLNDKGNLLLNADFMDGKSGFVNKVKQMLKKCPEMAFYIDNADILDTTSAIEIQSRVGDIWSLFKQSRGASTPKASLNFNAYNSDVANLTFKYVAKMVDADTKGASAYIKKAAEMLGLSSKDYAVDTSVDDRTLDRSDEKVKNYFNVQHLAMQMYLTDIGGARMQSFSDFIIEEVFDKMQLYADMAAQKFPLHEYTKEISDARIFGMTGSKINGSIIHLIDSKLPKEYAGLQRRVVNGEVRYYYQAGDYTNSINNGTPIQSIGWKDAVALMKDIRYSKNFGTIAIGFSDNHIRMMLDDPLIRMVIPYHTSGLPTIFAKLSGMKYANDYTNFQNTRNAKGSKLKDDGFSFNAAVQRNGGDARAAAKEYLEYCKENGYTPKFDRFSDHPNYYKLLEDFNSYDCVTEEAAPQGAVTINYAKANGLEDKDAYRARLENAVELYMTEDGVIHQGDEIFSNDDITKYIQKAQRSYQQIIKDELDAQKAYKDVQAPKYAEVFKQVDDMLDKYANRKALGINKPIVSKTSIPSYFDFAMKDMGLNPSIRMTKNSPAIDETTGDAYRLSEKVIDSDTLSFLNEQEERGDVIVTYKTMQIIDGRLYSPMAAKIKDENGKYQLSPPNTLGVWQQAVEDPSNIKIKANGKGYYTLNKGNGKSIDAAYNPYEHSSNLVLNDQFEEAYQRPNLVTVECIIPKSEMTSGYQAQYAKDPVGFLDWKAGTVAGQLTDNQRKVYLSRWLKPVRIVPDSEVASMYKDILSKDNISVPFNVVTPGLLTELEKQGVPVDYAGSPLYKAHHSESNSENARLSDKVDNPLDFPKKMGYNQYRSEKFAFEHSNKPIGTKRMLYNPNRNLFEFWEKTKYGIESIGESEPGEETEKLYEQIYRTTADTVYECTESFENAKGQDTWNSQLSEDRGNGFGNSAKSESEGLQSNSRGSGSNLLGGNSEKSIINEPSSTDGGFSMPNDRNSDKVDSERFNEKNDDIRYSDKVDDNGYFLSFSDEAALQEYYDTLDEALEYKRGKSNNLAKDNYEYASTYRRKVNEDDVRKVAKNFIGKNLSSADLDEVTRRLSYLYDYILNAGTVDWRNVTEIAGDIARTVMESSSKPGYKDYAEDYGELTAPDLVFGYFGTRERRNPDRQNKKALELAVGGDRLDRLRAKYEATIRTMKDDYQREIKSIKDAAQRDKIAYADERVKRKTAAMNEQKAKEKYRKQIQTLTGKISNKLLENNEVKNHKVPEELKKSVLQFCEIINDAGTFNSQKALRLSKAYRMLSDTLKPDDIEGNLTSFYDEEMSERIERLEEILDSKRFVQLTSAELKEVRDIAKYFNHIISESNKMLSESLKASLNEYQESAYSEVTSLKPNQKRFASAIQTGLTKPPYFFDNLGSKTMKEMYTNIRNGELTWARIVNEAKAKFESEARKHNYFKWHDDEISFKPNDDADELKLTVDEALAIYATWNRDQGKEHLLQGGIVLDSEAQKKLKSLKEKFKNRKDNKVDVKNLTIRLTEDGIRQLFGKLTAEQKEYADAMVNYLSTDMAELGNEVTMAMYGIRKFHEKSYFPISSNEDGLYSAGGNIQNVDNRIKHMSMTKALKPKANNAVNIRSFTETVMSHCSDMGLYNGLARPLEDFNRVYNYKFKDEAGNHKTLKNALRQAFGDKVNAYIQQLQSDINGAQRRDSGAKFVNKMIGMAKRNAVFGSMSVAIQQPSAVGRAMMYIDPKYFVKTTFSKRDYNELKKYAPVAIVKEMGYFDTGVGMQATEWMTKEHPEKMIDKLKAFVKDGSYRDDVLSALPSWMDEITWSHIWNATKREVADAVSKGKTLEGVNLKGVSVGSEEFLKACGDRFTYVIDRTQVYDSVFSRAEWMRSKDTGASVATAFMAENLTSLNMLYSAALTQKPKVIARATGAFLFSAALNSLLKSIITTAQHRDKDSDETLLIEYIRELVSNFTDGAFIGNLVPYFGTFMDMLNGYESERMDTIFLADIADAINKYRSGKPAGEVMDSVANVVGMAIGIPYKNMKKDVMGAWNTASSIVNGSAFGTTADDIGAAFTETLSDTFSGLPFAKQKTGSGAYRSMVLAHLNGDTKTYNKYSDANSDKAASSVKSGITTATKKLYLEEGKITREQAINALVGINGKDRDDAAETVNGWEHPENKKPTKMWGE